MLAKPLTERQIANSVSEVARQLGSQTQQNQQLIRQLGKLRGEASQSKLGIVSALVTLHGDLLDQASSEKSSRLLRALQAPHLDRQGQIRWMFLTVLCRAPTQLEQQRIYDMIQSQLDSVPASQVEGTESPQDRVKSAELSWQSDLLWALLNSSEFAMIP